MVDQSLYEGREPAFVKHTFLEQYIRDMLPKVSRFKKFVYVDLFAGPWKSRCRDYSDTSFGIALSQMAEAKKVQERLGHTVEMVAHLVEKESHEELKRAVQKFSGVDKIHVHPGTAEQFAQRIADSLPTDSFRFVVIDPKGLPDMRMFSWEEDTSNRFLFAQGFDKAIDQALETRRAIRSAPDNITFEIQASRLHSSEKALESVRLAGNAVIGVFFSGKKPKDRKKALAELHESLTLGSNAGWAQAQEFAAKPRRTGKLSQQLQTQILEIQFDPDGRIHRHPDRDYISHDIAMG